MISEKHLNEFNLFGNKSFYKHSAVSVILLFEIPVALIAFSSSKRTSDFILTLIAGI